MPNEIVTIDNIPVYRALVDDDNTGMLRISLVDEPAVMKDFVAMAAQEKQARRLLYSVEDEDKRLILGVVMRADFPIYRRTEAFGEYYVIYHADTIRKMAEKYLAENRQNLVNQMHEQGTEVEGVQMVQYFIKGRGINPQGFEDIADGSLFAEYHVTNDDVWAAIKEGTYKGFSLEGLFDLVPESDADYVEDAVEATKGIFSKIFNHLTEKNMTKTKGLLARLAAALVREAMGNVTTDKGILNWDSSEDLKAGDAVYVEDSEGGLSAAPDGEYKTEDGKVIVVADGKVKEIKDAEAEVAPETDSFGSKATDGGVLEWDGEDDLKAGDEVFITDEEGNRTPAPDGDYKTEDGKVIVVKDGKVEEIKDEEAEVAPVEDAFRRVAQHFEESYNEKSRKIIEAIHSLGFGGWLMDAGDDFAVICSYTDEKEKFIRFEVAWDENGNVIVSNPTEVKPAFVPVSKPAAAPESTEGVESLRSQVAELRAQVAKLSAMPAARAAHEEAEESAAIQLTGHKGLDKIARLMAAK